MLRVVQRLFLSFFTVRSFRVFCLMSPKITFVNVAKGLLKDKNTLNDNFVSYVCFTANFLSFEFL